MSEQPQQFSIKPRDAGLTIHLSNGSKAEAPTEAWVWAILELLAQSSPEAFEYVVKRAKELAASPVLYMPSNGTAHFMKPGH